MDADLAVLRGSARSLRRGVVVVAHKVAISSRRAALVARKEANCCWWDSYLSFNICCHDNSHCSIEGLELEGAISPIGLLQKVLRFREAWE